MVQVNRGKGLNMPAKEDYLLRKSEMRDNMPYTPNFLNILIKLTLMNKV
jgi:hypothetical protein